MRHKFYLWTIIGIILMGFFQSGKAVSIEEETDYCVDNGIYYQPGAFVIKQEGNYLVRYICRRGLWVGKEYWNGSGWAAQPSTNPDYKVVCSCDSRFLRPNICTVGGDGGYCGSDPCISHDTNCR